MGLQTSYNGDWHLAGDKGSIDWDKDGTSYSRLHRTEEKIEKRSIELLPVQESEQEMIDEFFAAIRENREPECSARDNLQSLAMVFGAIQSAKQGRVVALDEVF